MPVLRFIKKFLPILAIYGPMGNKKVSDKCYFKFGLYNNTNLTVKNPTTRENMTIWTDAMTVAKTNDKVLEFIKKDK